MMNGSEIIKNETMTSLEIAEVTGKEHKNVMRDIRNVLEQGVSQLNFELSSYNKAQPNGGTKSVPCYVLTKKGCLILASGYDVLLREKIINRWEELEKQVRKNEIVIPNFSNPAEAARAWADQYEKSKMLEAKIMEDEPFTIFGKTMILVKEGCLMEQFAKLLTQNGVVIGRNNLFKWLRENGYLCKRGESWNMPIQKYVEQDLFQIKTGKRPSTTRGEVETFTTKVTAKGQMYFINKFLAQPELLNGYNNVKKEKK